MATTSDRLRQHYHSLTGRPDHREPAWRQPIFKAFARTLGPWLPADRRARILDAGCGEGALLAFLRERGYERLDGFDLSPENVAICRAQGLDFVREADVMRLGAMEGEYDLVVSLDLLEHLDKDDAVPFLEGARARLAPGGALVIQTPNMGYVLAAYHRYNDLTHRFGVSEISARVLFRAAGFADDAVEIRPAWNATTAPGFAREIWLRILHGAVGMVEGSTRPRISTRNLLIRARR